MERIAVGVTGISAVDNPAPGVGVARSLKEDSTLDVKVVGLAYDAMEPGIYIDWVVDKSFLIPYANGAREGTIERLLYIKERSGLDFLLPSLDAELPFYIKYADELDSLGIKTFLPTSEQFKLRAKDRLPEVAREIGIGSPRTEVVSSYAELQGAVESMGFPVMVKGNFYGAYLARTPQEAAAYHDKLVGGFGYPLLVQEVVRGDELNVVGVGDGEGGSLGLVGIRKMWVTSLGKIWTGATIKNEAMLGAAGEFLRRYEWRGAFELECIVRDGEVHLIEINPRFPAWCYFATGVGVNLPGNIVRKAFGLPVDGDSDYEAGKLFIRYSYELITDMLPFQKVVTMGEN